VVADSLRVAVERRLVADVPVGVLLSGGLDSSLIVGLLAEAGPAGLNTFSVGFEASARRRATSSATPTSSRASASAPNTTRSSSTPTRCCHLDEAASPR
jgi:asparagine synthetase B (glutamine-hydrolysing)